MTEYSPTQTTPNSTEKIRTPWRIKAIALGVAALLLAGCNDLKADPGPDRPTGGSTTATDNYSEAKTLFCAHRQGLGYDRQRVLLDFGDKEDNGTRITVHKTGVKDVSVTIKKDLEISGQVDYTFMIENRVIETASDSKVTLGQSGSANPTRHAGGGVEVYDYSFPKHDDHHSNVARFLVMCDLSSSAASNPPTVPLIPSGY